MLYRVIMNNEGVLDDEVLDNMIERMVQIEDEFINEYKSTVTSNKNSVKNTN